MAPRTASRVLITPDSIGAERALVAALEKAADADPLGRKTIVVPSHSLRIGLLARLAGSRPAWLGLEVVTLRGLARGILERCGREHRAGDALLPVVVERLARSERALARHLETLIDGFAGAQGAVRDLLDAGFTAAHLEFAIERIDEERSQLGADALDRAAALCRVAARSRQELEALGLSVDADLYTGAAELLATEVDRAWPASTLFVHGFADATGVASDLLAEIVRQRETTAILLEPWDLDGESRGSWRFGRRLSERLQGVADYERIDSETAPARLRYFAASDPPREARAAVGLLAAQISTGERPEELAIVFRDPAPYSALLAREIDRQAFPASGTEGPPSPLARRARGLLELIERQGDVALGVAFAVAGEFLARGTGVRPWELRLGALALGARRLGAFAELEVALDPVLLPLNDRLVRVSQEANGSPARDDESRLSLRSRALPRESFRRAQRHAVTLLGRLASQNRLQPVSAAVEGIAALVELLFDSAEERQALLAPLAALAESARLSRSGFEVTAAEAALLFRGAWREGTGETLGGRGGGVALLSVTEARGRTFRRIVLAGLARDRFPRAVRADPFLPDNLRLRLRDLLPDLPVKSEGHDEERFLFAQLLGSAPEIDLFAPKADEEGKTLPPSSFLEELRRAGRIGAALPAADPERTSALDLACRTALENAPSALATALESAYREGETRFSPETAPASAAADWTSSHLALLAELGADPSAQHAAALGPFFGFVGERPHPEGESARQPDGSAGGADSAARLDPRRRAPAVTTLQSLAGCGWRTFLGKVLRLLSPLAGEDEIPELPSRLTGTVVHSVLERMAPPALREVQQVADAAGGPGVEVPWPEATALQSWIATATREALSEEGLDAELFSLALELAASEALAVVQRLDWPDGRRRLLGLEVEGAADLELPYGHRTVTFRADRVEASDAAGIANTSNTSDSALVLTDYKTGKTVVSDGAKAETRERHLEKALSEGRWLQLPAYARARADRPVEGRLLFLKAELEDDRRDVRLSAPASGSLAEARESEVWQTLFTAWDQGAFLPRLLDSGLEESHEECAYCEVRVACVQGDSGARLRLERWARARRDAEDGTAPPRADDSSDPASRLETSAWRLFELKNRAPRNATPGGS
ncbi:MAG: PD-(D/E)XK nuclease family protein [Thermoanaerobaculia bacterium]